MDKAVFYQKLAQAMLHFDFRPRASDLTPAGLSTDRDKPSSIAMAAAQNSPAGVPQPVSDQERIQQHLDKIPDWAAAVWYKYVMAQPVVIAVVEADRLAPEEIVGLANRFDEIVQEMLDVTGKLGFTKLSVTGIILLVFFDPTSAATFVARAQRRCKIWHFFQKTWVLPWVVDVSNEAVNSHPGLPFLFGVLSADRLQKEIFQ